MWESDKGPPPSVRTLLARVRDRADEIVEVMLAHYRGEISAYQQLPSDLVDRDVREVSRRNLLAFLDGLERPALLDGEVASLRDVGARRARQGLALADVLHAYRAGARIAWAALLDETAAVPRLSRADVGHLAGALLDYLDRVSTAVEEAYFEEWQANVFRTARRRWELAGALLGAPDPAAVRRLATDAGVVLPDTVVVAALAAGRQAPLDSDREVPGFLAEVQGRSVFFLDARSSDEAVAALALRCGSVLGCADPRPWSPDGLGAAFATASRIADLAARLGLDGAVRADEVAAHRVLSADPEAAQSLFESTLGALVRADRSGDLLATVETYLESGCSLVATAQQLHVHPNTVTYRLRAAAGRGGVALDTPDERFAVLLALRARRVLGPV